MAARSKAYTIFCYSNIGIMGLNSALGMGIYCICVFYMSMLSFIGRGIGAHPPSKEDCQISISQDPETQKTEVESQLCHAGA
jgi:hypothetical protein